MFTNCRLFEYLSDNSLNFPVIHHIQFPSGIHRYFPIQLLTESYHNLILLLNISPLSLSCLFRRDDLVIRAGTYAGTLLVDGLGDGIFLEAPDQDFEFLRNTSFNLLQGCRMRNTKTVYFGKKIILLMFINF